MWVSVSWAASSWKAPRVSRSLLAILATVFFNALPATAPSGAPGTHAQVFGEALAHVMPWQVATYLLAAFAMLALPKAAAAHQG